MGKTRHISAQPSSLFKGRNVIALMGINQYDHLSSLTNAVNDVNEVQSLFQQLRFEIAALMLDEQVTGAAMRTLASDGLRKLKRDDNLVIYFAGHGYIRIDDAGGDATETGYLIPCDGTREEAATWIDIRDWLQVISRLSPMHILVIIDACYSGSAAGSNRSRVGDPATVGSEILMSRGPPAESSAASEDSTDGTGPRTAPLAHLYRRRSRQLICSTYDDQEALDGGPGLHHSPFTNWLLDALRGGANGYCTEHGHVTTAMEVATAVQRTAWASGSTTQFPVFDRFGNDKHGELLIPMLGNGTVQPDRASVTFPEGMAAAGASTAVEAMTLAEEIAIAQLEIAVTNEIERDVSNTRAHKTLMAFVAVGIVAVALGVVLQFDLGTNATTELQPAVSDPAHASPVSDGGSLAPADGCLPEDTSRTVSEPRAVRWSCPSWPLD